MDDPNRSSLELLLSISRELSSTLNLNEVLEKIARLSAESLGAERCALVALDADGKPSAAEFVSHGETLAFSEPGIVSTLEHGLAGWVLRTGRAALVTNTGTDERWLVRPDDLSENTGEKSALCVPLSAREQVVGVMTIVHPVPGFFNEEHLALLQAIGTQAGMFLHNAMLFGSLEQVTYRYRELFNDNLLPLLITDREGIIVESNRQAERLLELESPGPGKNLFSVLAPGVELPEGNGLPRIFETSISRSQASIPIEANVHGVNIDGKALLQWTLIDLTDRKALDGLRDDLMAMVYHDLRTPLANIISSLDLVEAYMTPDAEPVLTTAYGIASRSARRLQRTLLSLLDAYRMEAGEMALQMGDVNMAELIADAMEIAAPLIENRRQTLHQRIDSLPPQIKGDPDILQRVLTNLLENASKYTPSEGEVWIGANCTENWVKLWVQDSGPGIPTEARESIFAKFTQLQPERSPKGYGIGLTFCRLAVQAHGGRIWVESPGGQGSRFVFTLPYK